MWNKVNQQISESLHDAFELSSKQTLKSYGSKKLYKIADDTHQFLVKVAPIQALERFECEASNREKLIRDSDFLVADTITLGTSVEFCFIVLEWLELDHRNENWLECGQSLAKMHQRHEQEMFGLEEDNYIHELPQPNQWHKKWEVFFAEERIGWQLQLLAEKGIILTDIDTFVEQLKPLLPHQVQPSLVHGNFWHGNIGFSRQKPVLFSPACYYGDREVDIAMASLFAPLPDDFYRGYGSIYPLAENAAERLDIYRLYPLLVQANLFAGKYIRDAAEQVQALLK
ncbi:MULTISPECIES: fructosamine kinase family protein [Pseudoalteromonas]|uniref:fructosamine kinase family protein n=1 Tax=Pseudoalteromonas TaxID=53246 RepID=UPI000FFF61BB|nr:MULTISPECIES: fructosamine kinase family protein [Pseudoalteromonas]MCG9760638.1 fructosamine kinase family protein [Pseudoalteromonas sp. Isolate6]NKC18463.1 phosphotransferase [Pseudoalteromonas galatheae]RXE84996.1 fructosamine kinase family protein [Pseudoalteromonas sp. A757]